MKPAKEKIWDEFAEGCYFDGSGIEILAFLGSRKTKLLKARDRYPTHDAAGRPYSKKNNADLILRRMQLKDDLRNGRIAGADGAPGSLGFAIDKFLETHPVKKTADGKNDPDDRTNADLHFALAHWRRSTLKDMPIATIRRRDIAAILDAMVDAGSAPASVNRRKRALGTVLRIELEKKRRDDEDVIVPTDLIKDVPPPDPEARGVPLPIMLGILAEVPDQGRAAKGEKRPTYSETKIRLGVMVWSGMSHASTRRLAETSVKWAKERVFLPRRRKARGAPAVWVDAMPGLMEALRAFDRANLWGKGFSNSSMHSSWARAVARRRAKLEAAAKGPDATAADRTLWEEFRTNVPANCHPYDTRHAFLTEVLHLTNGNERAAQELAQHKDPRTIQRYTKAAVPVVVKHAIAAMRAAWAPGAADPPARDFQIVERANKG